MSGLEDLATLPAGIKESSDLIERFDACFHVGFARLDSANRESLNLLAASFGGTPLHQLVSDAVAAVGRSEFVARHFSALAAARAALQGSQYDALRSQALHALDRESPGIEDPEPQSPGGSAAMLGSVQQWLMEIALAGFHHLDEDAVAPFAATLENLQAQTELTGLAALLTGFVNELLVHMPTERQESLPVFRWGDLWTATMIRTQQIPGVVVGQKVSGVVSLLGVDLQAHSNFVCANVYGVLDTGGEFQTVRIPLTSYKVDAIADVEVWELFGDVSDPILKGLEGHKSLQIANAELRSNGELILKAKPKLGRASDPFDVAKHISALPPAPALIRHPVHLAELCVSGNCGLPIATERLPNNTELTDTLLKAAADQIGLLRFDQGGWRIQPLCVKGPKKTVIGGEGIAKARSKLKSKTLAILRERSSKLLRGA